MRRRLPPFDARLAADLLLFVLVTVFLGLGLARPRTFAALMQEDAWVEWTTVAAMAMAATLAFIGGLSRDRPILARIGLIGVGAFTLFVAGEEISWGQRLFSFRPPELFLEKNYQQEANLHNLLKALLDTRWMVLMIALAYGVAAPLLARTQGRLPRLIAGLSPELRLAPWFLLVAALELFYPFELTGELAEMLLGLVFVLDVSDRLAKGAAKPSAFHRAVLLQAGALLLGLILVPLVDSLTLGQAQKRLPEATRDLAALNQRLGAPGALRPRLLKKKTVHKRVFTAVRAGYVELGEREYFLDAWNQPYWIAFARIAKHRGTLLLYSFGPNRRRDSEIDEVAGAQQPKDVLRGDDLGVLQVVEWTRTASGVEIRVRTSSKS